jgi:transposase
MLLPHGKRYTGKTSWTLAHARFLAGLSFAHPAQNIAFVEYRAAVTEAHERLERIVAALREQVSQWRLLPVVNALMTLRGVEFIAAVTLVAELGDLKRFAHPKQLTSFLGLVPSESSSGASRSLGSITKAGNSLARRLLIEAAWCYRFALCHRYRRLQARGLHQNKICVAIARELCGFMWDLAQHLPNLT